MLECVINVSEGRRHQIIEAVSGAAGPALLDVHSDPHHHRSVVTVAGEEAARSVTVAALDRLDLRLHEGVHPRFGVVDVVPFVPLAGSSMDHAVAARDRFSSWLASEREVPCFRYGPERDLPDVRRRAFKELTPDDGPGRPHPAAGATAVGARGPLVAYNVWLAQPDPATARRVAAEIRGPAVRALGLAVGARVQVSMNLIAPWHVGPAEAFDAVATRAEPAGAELVGLLPAAVLESVPRTRWAELDLSEDRSIEARLARMVRPAG